VLKVLEAHRRGGGIYKNTTSLRAPKGRPRIGYIWRVPTGKFNHFERYSEVFRCGYLGITFQWDVSGALKKPS